MKPDFKILVLIWVIEGRTQQTLASPSSNGCSKEEENEENDEGDESWAKSLVTLN